MKLIDEYIGTLVCFVMFLFTLIMLYNSNYYPFNIMGVVAAAMATFFIWANDRANAHHQKLMRQVEAQIRQELFGPSAHLYQHLFRKGP